jgi:hypothetical protein
MNNNLYHWHDEHIVNHEMQEVNRTLEQTRLLKEAVPSHPGLLARLVKVLCNLLRMRRATVRIHRALEHESCQSIEEN